MDKMQNKVSMPNIYMQKNEYGVATDKETYM